MGLKIKNQIQKTIKLNLKLKLKLPKTLKLNLDYHPITATSSIYTHASFNLNPWLRGIVEGKDGANNVALACLEWDLVLVGTWMKAVEDDWDDGAGFSEERENRDWGRRRYRASDDGHRDKRERIKGGWSHKWSVGAG